MMTRKKTARKSLRQSEVFLPLADHAIVAHHVVPRNICSGRIQNRRGFRSCHRRNNNNNNNNNNDIDNDNDNDINNDNNNNNNNNKQ